MASTPFLATTALQEFRVISKDVLLLGPWCVIPDEAATEPPSKEPIISNPWTTLAQVERALHDLDNTTEFLLEQLTFYLNGVHHVSHDKRYWRILLGPWMLFFVQSFYDRYLYISSALKHAPNLTTIVLDPSDYRVPTDMDETYGWLAQDDYNLQLFSQIFAGLGYNFPTRVFKQMGHPPAASPPTKRLRLLKNGMVPYLEKEFAWLHRNKLQFIHSGLNVKRTSSWPMAWKSNFQILPMEIPPKWSFPLRPAILNSQRLGLKEITGRNSFEKILLQSLPQNFPTLYLEHYVSATAEINCLYRLRPNGILSASSWYHNEPFKFFAAAAAERGTRLIALQHGGSYGISSYEFSEMHELRLANRYIAWGWATPDLPNHINLPSPKLSISLNELQSGNDRVGGAILFVATAQPRYARYVHPMPMGDQWMEFYGWEERFIGALSPSIRSSLLFRPFYTDYGKRIGQRIGKRFPDVRLDADSQFIPSLKQSSLVIIDNCSTTFLEALSANKPTILFWDPKRWGIRPAAAPYFDELRAAGILWNNPEAAAGKVSNIWDDVESWWQEPSMQKARRNFVEHFALADRDWIERWVKALQAEAKA